MRRAIIDFDRKLGAWDGFGVNYVEAAQTRDYGADPQEYGGFSTLSCGDRETILDMTFGPDGLLPGVVKMFLDPWHQAQPGPGYDYSSSVITPASYDHTCTTKWMRYFAREGLRRLRAHGRELSVLTTLYSPPGWMTKQRFIRGRDLDPKYKHEVAKYMIDWVRYLRQEEGLPIDFVSLHNEGEDWARWPLDGSGPGTANHDYNLYWPPEQVADFIAFMRQMLDDQGLHEVGLALGETTNWYRFCEWGYADAIADHPQAMANLGLITSHGFMGLRMGRGFGDHRSRGNDILRAKNPKLHSWTTSTSWSKMDANFCWEIRDGIYGAKVNAIIPWALVQRSSLWVGGDPNPGTAFRVDDGGRFSVERGYYMYKQVSRAGQPGMAVARTSANDSDIGLIAFASNGTRNPDAFVVINQAEEAKSMEIQVLGSEQSHFALVRSTDMEERYAPQGTFEIAPSLVYTAPARSVGTFFGIR